MTMTDDVAKRYGIHVRRVDMHHYNKDVQNVDIDLSNRNLINNWGYTSVTKQKLEAVAARPETNSSTRKE